MFQRFLLGAMKPVAGETPDPELHVRTKERPRAHCSPANVANSSERHGWLQCGRRGRQGPGARDTRLRWYNIRFESRQKLQVQQGTRHQGGGVRDGDRARAVATPRWMLSRGPGSGPVSTCRGPALSLEHR